MKICKFCLSNLNYYFLASILNMSYDNKHYIENLTIGYAGFAQGPNPNTTNYVVFTSDGTNGLIDGALYYNTPTGLINLSGAATGAGLTGGINVGTGAEIYKEVSGSNFVLKTLVAGSNVTITENTNEIIINSSTSGSTSEVITTSVNTSIDINTTNTFVNLDTAGTTISTLVDGSIIGQEKNILIETNTLNGLFRVNINTFVGLNGGSGIQFDTAGQSANLKWSNSGWILNGGSGAIVF